MADPHPTRTPLWPVPLAIALLFLGAVHLAWWLSLQAGTIPACVPYWEGCVSISRAARHGLGNHLFRLAVLPCALLHLLNWWLARRWLKLDGDRRDFGAGAVFALGAISALALAVYTTFLGTDGEAYRFLRRYGVVLYFGCGYLAQLLFLRLASQRGKLPRDLARLMLAACVAMLALGVASVVVSAVLEDPQSKDRWENALEWQLGLLSVFWFVLLALVWKRDGFAIAAFCRSDVSRD